jgi:cysteine desulfurase/selenocysteine lyase
MNDISMDKVEKHERRLTTYFLNELEKISEVEILSPNPNKMGIVSFTLKEIHPTDIAFILSQQNICVRVGHQCAMPLHQRLGKEISLRVSFGIYNEKEDICRVDHCHTGFLGCHCLCCNRICTKIHFSKLAGRNCRRSKCRY